VGPLLPQENDRVIDEAARARAWRSLGSRRVAIWRDGDQLAPSDCRSGRRAIVSLSRTTRGLGYPCGIHRKELRGHHYQTL